MKNKWIEKLLYFVLIVTWIILSFSNPYMNSFHRDELWAYNIATDLNLSEIIRLMHYEGHTILWYMILKPFTYLPSLYPNILKYINYFISCITMFIFWKYSPINNFIKILISFTTPFIIIYPSYARPYSLTMFFLFTLVILFKDRFKIPLIYSIILILAINCGICGAIFALPVCIYFICEISRKIIDKESIGKDFLSLFILISGILLLILQWIPFYIPSYVPKSSKFIILHHFLFSENVFLNNLVGLIIFLIIITFIYLSTRNNKLHIGLGLLGISTISFFVLFFSYIYIGADYHFYFIYIYLILIYWLWVDNDSSCNFKNVFFVIFSFVIIILSLLLNGAIKQTVRDCTPKNTINATVEKINREIPHGSTIIVDSHPKHPMELYYQLKKNYNLINCYNEKISSFGAYTHVHHEKDIDLNAKYPPNTYLLTDLNKMKRKKSTKKFNIYKIDKYIILNLNNKN